MGTEFHLVSKEAQRALEEFSEQFSAAMAQGGVDPWAKELGLYRASKALKTTFPVPVSAAGYAEFMGDVKYRSIFQKSLELVPKTWQDGVSELASVIEAPDFIGWTSEPAAIAQAAMSLPNEIIAGLLESNPASWTGQTFFHAAHPQNIFDTSAGTFSNLRTGATLLNDDNLGKAKEYFRKIKAPNGKPMGLRMTHLMVPPALEQTAKKLLEQDLIVQTVGTSFAAVNNLHKGTVKLVVADELTDDAKWYALALNKPGMSPWIVQDEGAPEEIRHDKDSSLYKSSLKVGLAYVMRGNGVLALPHAVQRFAGTAS
jgi:phage major head subunit gpT-like protein